MIREPCTENLRKNLEITNNLGYPLLICSYKLFDYCKARYPSRNVVADVHVDYDDFYYWTKTNILRICRNKTEILTGGPWPYVIKIRG